MTTYEGKPLTTTFTKLDNQKPRTDLLCPDIVIEIAEVLSHGAQKYIANNWKLCTTPDSTYVGGAALRHILAHLDGEELDPESGLSHLAHALCSLMFGRWLNKHGSIDNLDSL